MDMKKMVVAAALAGVFAGRTQAAESCIVSGDTTRNCVEERSVVVGSFASWAWGIGWQVLETLYFQPARGITFSFR